MFASNDQTHDTSIQLNFNVFCFVWGKKSVENIVLTEDVPMRRVRGLLAKCFCQKKADAAHFFNFGLIKHQHLLVQGDFLPDDMMVSQLPDGFFNGMASGLIFAYKYSLTNLQCIIEIVSDSLLRDTRGCKRAVKTADVSHVLQLEPDRQYDNGIFNSGIYTEYFKKRPKLLARLNGRKAKYRQQLIHFINRGDYVRVHRLLSEKGLDPNYIDPNRGIPPIFYVLTSGAFYQDNFTNGVGGGGGDSRLLNTTAEMSASAANATVIGRNAERLNQMTFFKSDRFKSLNMYIKDGFNSAEREDFNELCDNMMDGGNFYNYSYASYTARCIMLDVLLKFGAHLDFRDQQGRTMLHYALLLGDYFAVKLLVKLGANLNDFDGRGDPAWFCAVQPHIPYEFMFYILSQAAVRIDMTNDDSQTALHVCCSNNWPTHLELVLYAAINANKNKAGFNKKFGAFINHKNRNTNSALHMAALKRSVECAKVLLKYGADADLRNNSNLSAFECGAHYCDCNLNSVLNQNNFIINKRRAKKMGAINKMSNYYMTDLTHFSDNVSNCLNASNDSICSNTSRTSSIGIDFGFDLSDVSRHKIKIVSFKADKNGTIRKNHSTLLNLKNSADDECTVRLANTNYPHVFQVMNSHVFTNRHGKLKLNSGDMVQVFITLKTGVSFGRVKSQKCVLTPCRDVHNMSSLENTEQLPNKTYNYGWFPCSAIGLKSAAAINSFSPFQFVKEHINMLEKLSKIKYDGYIPVHLQITPSQTQMIAESGSNNNNNNKIKKGKDKSESFPVLGFEVAYSNMYYADACKQGRRYPYLLSPHFIRHVNPGSSADLNGFRVGDRIVAVNNVDVTRMSAMDFTTLLYSYLARHSGACNKSSLKKSNNTTMDFRGSIGTITSFNTTNFYDGLSMDSTMTTTTNPHQNFLLNSSVNETMSNAYHTLNKKTKNTIRKVGNQIVSMENKKKKKGIAVNTGLSFIVVRYHVEDSCVDVYKHEDDEEKQVENENNILQIINQEKKPTPPPRTSSLATMRKYRNQQPIAAVDEDVFSSIDASLKSLHLSVGAESVDSSFLNDLNDTTVVYDELLSE